MTKLLLALMASTALVPAVASAQSAPTQTEEQRGAALPDIVVTAQRYEQRLQDVPISVSVIGAEELASRGVVEISDLQYSVPGFSTYEYGVGRQYLQLRGVSNTIGTTTIGIYLDETPLALDSQGDAISLRLHDMERVEVLRGPQATLYGQGSMGGTIRYVPAAPRLDAIGGSFDGEYSSTQDGDNNYKAVGVFNLPIATDRVGVRLLAGYEQIGGFIDNAATGESDINSTEIFTARGTLLADVSDRLSLSLMALYQESTQDNQTFGTNRITNSLVPTPVDDRYTIVQGKAVYQLDFAELSGSVYNIDRRNQTVYDVSPLFVPVLNAVFGLPPGFIDRIGLGGDVDYNIWGGELRMMSQTDGRFGWQFGATYRDYETSGSASTYTEPGSLPFVITASQAETRTKSAALYGEVSYAFMPRLTGVAGLRYFKEDKTADAVNTSFGVAVNDIGDATFESFNPRFNLSYEISPTAMVFANIAKGFRSGGFNNTSAGGGVIPIAPTYEPDEIWTYELGTKHQLFGSRLLLDASLYRSEWSKVQSYSFAPGSALSVVTNSGDVAGWGLDFSATARPVRSLTLSATYGWNNLEFTRSTGDKAPGDAVDAAIRESYSLSVDYRPRLTDRITGIARLDYQHAGPGSITARNFAPPTFVDRPGRDLVNLRLGAEIGDVEIALFANNLFDEDAAIIRGPYGPFADDLEQRPRVVGISLNARY